jgi:hypothetical protein
VNLQQQGAGGSESQSCPSASCPHAAQLQLARGRAEACTAHRRAAQHPPSEKSFRGHFSVREVRGSLDHCVRCGRYPHSSTLLLISLVGVQCGGHESSSGRCAHARADSVRREGFLATRRVRAAPRAVPLRAPRARSHGLGRIPGEEVGRWRRGGGRRGAGGAGQQKQKQQGEGRPRQMPTWRGIARGPEGARASLARLETGIVFSIQKAGLAACADVPSG